MIADPICMFDCDIPVDGVATFVLHVGRAGARPAEPAGATSRDTRSGTPTTRRLPLHWPLDDIMDAAFETARRLWAHTGLAPDDVDLPQVYDGFSPFVWFWLEALGRLPGGRGARVRRRRRHRQRRRPVPSRRCRAAARWATAACTACPRCWSATCSCAGRAGGPPAGERGGRRRVPQLTALRRRRRLPPGLSCSRAGRDARVRSRRRSIWASFPSKTWYGSGIVWSARSANTPTLVTEIAPRSPVVPAGRRSACRDPG